MRFFISKFFASALRLALPALALLLLALPSPAAMKEYVAPGFRLVKKTVQRTDGTLIRSDTYTYNAAGLWDTWIFTQNDAGEIDTIIRKHVYDKDNRLMLEIDFNEDKEAIQTREIFYNAKGKITGSLWKNKNGVPMMHLTITQKVTGTDIEEYLDNGKNPWYTNTIEHNAKGDVTAITHVNHKTGYHKTSKNEYDKSGRLVKETHEEPKGELWTHLYEYGASDKVVKIRTTVKKDGAVTESISTCLYDAAGNLTEVRDFDKDGIHAISTYYEYEKGQTFEK